MKETDIPIIAYANFLLVNKYLLTTKREFADDLVIDTAGASVDVTETPASFTVSIVGFAIIINIGNPIENRIILN
jgi:hypothetical protein